MPSKADVLEIQKMKKKFEGYASYEDYKELYNKVVPPIQQFEEQVISFSGDLERNREVIRRFDEVMLEKANKSNLSEISDQMLRFVSKDDFARFESRCERDINRNADEMRRLEDLLDSINAEVNNEIISAVKRATLHITSKIG